jgi:DNA-binding MarR family transcriptional regulator
MANDDHLETMAKIMVGTLPKWGHWASSFREFETPHGKVGYRQLQLLWILRHHLLPRDMLTPTRLATYFRVQPSVMTGVIQRLTQAGLIERMADEADSRLTLLAITPAGIDVSQFVEAYFNAQVIAALRQLGAEDVRAIDAALGVLDRLVTSLVSGPEGSSS